MSDTFVFGPIYKEDLGIGLSTATGQILADGSSANLTQINLSQFAHKEFALAYSASITVDVSQGDIGDVIVSDGNAFTLNNPVNGFTGQEFTIRIFNESGGAAGTATFGSAYKLSAWTQAGNGFNRAISFVYNGTFWYETWRNSADIPN